MNAQGIFDSVTTRFREFERINGELASIGSVELSQKGKDLHAEMKRKEREMYCVMTYNPTSTPKAQGTPDIRTRQRYDIYDPSRRGKLWRFKYFHTDNPYKKIDEFIFDFGLDR